MTETRPVNPLQDLGYAYSALMDAQADVTFSVIEARRAGASWDEIGRETNMSKQAAWERWRKVDPGQRSPR